MDRIRSIVVKKIISYSIGWDSQNKQGYLTTVDEQKQTHAFGKLGLEEFKLLHDMLKEANVFIDNNKWLICGWEEGS